MPSNDDWFTCPVCGEVVPADALACAHCGSCDETGWSEDSMYDDVDLPDEAFGEPVRGTSARRRRVISTAVGLMLVALIVLLTVMNVW